MSGRTKLPRLLLGIPRAGRMSLGEHLRIHGEAPLGSRGGAALILDAAERAGLRGRGGAGFPTAVKMRAAAAGRRPVVVANGAEGEPASRKDLVLLERLPHLVIDGGLLAAEAIGAGELIVCVHESAADGIRRALRDRAGRDGRSTPARVEVVPEGYVVGQESALVNHLSGGPALPTMTPPRPTERGVRRRPTLIDNVETLAHLALIARHGPEWFRELGTVSEPGSALVTLSGAVVRPGVYEIEHGSRMVDLMRSAGGASESIRAVLIGGYSGTWLPADRVEDVRLCAEDLVPLGAALGNGAIFALPADACPVAETARIMRWLSDQSAGQCGPCVHGLEAIAGAVEQIARGGAAPGAGGRIARWQELVTRRGACGHPDASARFIASALREFAPEFGEHDAHGPCDRCADRSVLPLPRPCARPGLAGVR